MDVFQKLGFIFYIQTLKVEKLPIWLKFNLLCCAARALEDGEDSDSDEEEEVASLDEDEDELDEEADQYLELLQKKVQDASPSSPFTISSQIIEVSAVWRQATGSVRITDTLCYAGYHPWYSKLLIHKWKDWWIYFCDVSWAHCLSRRPIFSSPDACYLRTRLCFDSSTVPECLPCPLGEPIQKC